MIPSPLSFFAVFEVLCRSLRCLKSFVAPLQCFSPLRCLVRPDFIKKSIILSQTVIVCHACFNNAPIMATHRVYFIVCMRDAAHSHVLPSVFVFQPHQLHLKVLRYRYILTKCCFEVIFSNKFFLLLLQICCWIFHKIDWFKNRIGFGILNSVVTIRNNSGIVNYSEMPIPS